MSVTPQDDLSYLGSAETPAPSGAPGPPKPNGEAAPEPVEKPQSLMVRLPRYIHSELQALAIETGLSMNEFMLFGCELLLKQARAVGQAAIMQEVITRRAERRKTR